MNNNPAIIKRTFQDEIKPYLNRKEYIAIRGARQAGKTTFMKELEKEFTKSNIPTNFLSFEDREMLSLFEDDIKSFVKLQIEPYKVIFIDEFQYAKEGGQKLKFIYDSTNVKIIVSGSSSLELQAKTGKYMVGRMLYFELSPFSFTEYLTAKDKDLLDLISNNQDSFNKLISGDKSIFENNIQAQVTKSLLTSQLCEYIIYGGYPAVVLEKDNEIKETLLKNIFQTYISKDIADLLRLETDSELIKLARLLALQIGNLVVYDNLSAETGLYHDLLKKHMDILNQTYIVEFLQPYYTNKRTEIVKNPIPYFLDTGLRNSLINNFSDLKDRFDKGSLFENYVFSALKRHVISTYNIKFWRSKSQAEVDFILEPKAGYIIPIEVKSTTGSNASAGKSFYSFISKYKPEIAIVITMDKFEEHIKNGTKIYYIPAFWL